MRSGNVNRLNVPRGHALNQIGGSLSWSLIYLRLGMLFLALGAMFAIFRARFFGYSPVVESLFHGLLLGIIVGKSNWTQHKGNRILGFILAVVVTSMGYFFGLSVALQTSNLPTILVTALYESDLRETITWFPRFNIALYTNKISSELWFALNLAGFALWVLVTFLVAQISRGNSKQTTRNNRQILRLTFMTGVLALLVFFTQKEQFFRSQTNYELWQEELLAFPLVRDAFVREEGISMDASRTQKSALEQFLEDTSGMKSLPEVRLLRTLHHLREGHVFLAEAELDRAIYDTENLNRDSLTSDNLPLWKDRLLIHLYHLRAKLNLHREQFLTAERDLTVAIILHKEQISKNEWMNEGFFRNETETLEAFGIRAGFGLAECFFDRYVARKGLGDDVQSQVDLESYKQRKNS